MNRNYRVESVEPRDRISYQDFFMPRHRVTLVREEDGEVLNVLFPIRRSPRRGERILLDDQELRAIQAPTTTGAGIARIVTN